MKYYFNSLNIDTELYRLISSDDEVKIEPQVFDLLLYLIEHRDRVVSREELLEKLWEGKIVTDAALGARLKAVRKAVGDDGTKQSIVKTIHGRGYQFIADISESEKNIPDVVEVSQIKNINTSSLPEKSSIAVLPFQNLSNDPDQEYFSDGLSEDLITELSRFRELFVIARNSSFVFRGKPVSTDEICKTLGVRYILEGSVLKSGDQLRIRANLIDAVSGNQIWGEHYDRKVNDIFAVQDEVVKQTIGAVTGHLRHTELDRIDRKTPSDLRAYELVLQATSKIAEMRKDLVNEGILLLEHALEIEPDYSLATGWLCCAQFLNSAWRWVPNPDQMREVALNNAKRTVKLDEAWHMGHWSLSEILLYSYKNLDEAKIHAERAFSLNPSSSETMSWMGFIYCVEGNIEQGVSLIEDALRLDPLAPGYQQELMGASQYLLGNYEESVLRLKASNLESIYPLIYLVAAFQASNRNEEAKATADKILHIGKRDMEILPDNWAEHLVQASGFVRDTDIGKYRMHITKAGIPDGPIDD